MAARVTLLHFRFDEDKTELLPSDAMGSVADLVTTADPVPVVDGLNGSARYFGPSRSFTTSDIVPGASLASRDVTVQAIVQWDLDQQNAIGFPGTLVQRGISGSAAERTAYRVDLRVIDAATRLAEIRFVWETTAGVQVTAPGGQFTMPALGQWLVLTATRHWISPTEVELQYYAGSTQLADHIVSDADIGGGTTGTLRLGLSGTTNYFCGVVDELRVMNFHVASEEVEATWLRMSKWQPDGYTTVRQLFQTRAPISNDPTSRVQRIFRGVGQALGYANAQIDNFRRNAMPDRAYGTALERWEGITQEAPRGLDTTADRRRRVLGHMAQRQGSSPPGVRAAVKDLLAVQASQLEVLAFSNDIADDFSSGSVDPKRWWVIPTSGATVNVSGGAMRFQLPTGDRRITNSPMSGPTIAAMSVQGDARATNLIAKITTTSLGSDVGAGLMFVDWVKQNAILFEVYNEAGVIRLQYQLIKGGGGVGSIPVVLATPPPASPFYLHLYQEQDSNAFANPPVTGSWRCAWGASLTAMTTSVAIAHPSAAQWACCYGRSLLGAIPVASDVSFDDVILRQRYGSRPFYWYVYRDPALPGVSDVIGAQRVAARLAHAHTRVGVITNKIAKCDDAATQCDNTPLGSL